MLPGTVSYAAITAKVSASLQECAEEWPYSVVYNLPSGDGTAESPLVEVRKAGFNSRALAEHFCSFIGGRLVTQEPEPDASADV